MRSTLRDASSAGLMTAVHPVARTGPRTHHWLIRGPFHGMMPPTTPTGAFSDNVVMLPGSELGKVSPATFSAWLA